MASDSLSLLFQLDADGRPAVAEFQRVRRAFASEIAALRKSVMQSFTLPPIRLPTVQTGGRTGQADAHVKEFRRIEAEAKKSAKVQEAEQSRLNRAVQSLQRQRSAAIIAGWKAEERAAAVSLRAQERAAQQASRAIANAFRGIGPGLQSIGRTLTIGITAPLLALGAASLKSAKDIDANVNTLKAFTGSAEAAERRLAELIKTARGTPGLTTNLALTLDAQLRVAKTTEETINRILPAVGRLNAVSPLADPGRFVNNLRQIVEQNFERPDLKELVGQSPIAGQLITEIFNVDSPINSKAIRAAAQKMGLTTTEAFFKAFAEAAERNRGLNAVTESIGTRFDKIVDRVSVALRPLGLAILNAIEPFVEPIARVIERISEAFNRLPQSMKTLIVVAGAIAAAVGPVLFVLGSIITSLGGVVKAAAAVGAVIGLIGFPELILVVGGLVVVIGEWVAILAALGLAWKNNFLNIRGLVTDAASAVLEAFTRIKTVFEEATTRILPSLQSISTKVIGAITVLWERYGATVVRVVSVAFQLIVGHFERLVRFLGNVIDLIAKLIDSDWRGAWRAFSRIIINALDSISEFFSKALPIITRGFLTLNAFIIRQAVTFVQTAARLASQFILTMVTSFIAGAPQISDALAKMLILAAAGVAVGPIGVALVARMLESMRKAAAEGVTVPVTVGPSVGADVGAGAGIFRKKTPLPITSAEGAGKGADAETKRRIRLLELEADRADAIARQRINAENILFEQRKTSLKEFTDFQIREEQIVFEKKKAVFVAERAEAEKLGKGRDLALGEIRLKELKAELEFAERRNQLLANQQREELEAAKSHRQALLDIQDEGDQKQLELIDSYVERYLISFEEAERRRIVIEEDARKRRRGELETQLGEAGKNVQEQQRIKDAIAKLDAESATAKEEAENRKRRALRATLEAEQDYYDTLVRISQTARELLRDAAEIQLGRLINRFGDRRKFRLEALRLEREANQQEHQQRLRQIEQEKQDAEKRLEGVRDAEEKLLALRKRFAELERAEKERRAAERKKEDDDERDVRDPFSSLRRRFEQFKFDIQNVNDSITDSLQSVSERVNNSIGAMGDALRQGIVAWILYGESLGKALKRALAEQLATLAAEFAIQALKHAAYALGSLAFGNFAGAAKHAAAAAAFTAAAAATGFAGRALAKSAGLYKPGGTTALAAVNGGEPPARNAAFNYGGQGPVETSSQAVREGSGGIFGRLAARIEAFQQQSLEVQRQQQLHNALVAQALTRLGTARPGDVVTAGASDARQAIGVAVIDHSNASGDFNEAMQRNLGFAR